MDKCGQGMRQRRRAGPRPGGAARNLRAGGRRQTATSDDMSLTTRTASRALVAVGAYLAQDLRDPDGMTRPMLRKAALRMVGSGLEPIRRIGAAYLRSDVPWPEEIEAFGSDGVRQLPPAVQQPNESGPAPCDLAV